MLILKGGRVLDPASGFDGKADVFIGDGKILQIGGTRELSGTDEVLNVEGFAVAPGLVDTHVHFRDPGFTYKEDIYTGASAAAAGGFTSVVCMANTSPAADNPETLQYIAEKAAKAKIHVYQAAAVTKGLKGRELTDFAALRKAGAAGFTDDGIPICDAALLEEAMMEAARLGVPVSLHEEDPSMIARPGVNRGRVSALLDYGGAPAESEYTLAERDCGIALRTRAEVVIQHISAARTVDVVRDYWHRGAKVHGAVTPQHFSLTEEIVLQKGSLARVNPPIRTQEDRLALIEGLRDGTLDIIATDHAPHSREEKARDIKDAPSGMIGLETSLALGITNLVLPGHLTLLELLEKMTVNPARLYRLPAGTLSQGAPADVTVFDPDEEWTVEDRFYSKSNNSPFIGQRLTGKVKYTVCGGRVVYEG